MNQRSVSSYHSENIENGCFVPCFQKYFFQYIRNAEYDDVERGERGNSEEHLTVTQFKVAREQERLAQIQAVAALAQAVNEQKKREVEATEKKAAQGQAGQCGSNYRPGEGGQDIGGRTPAGTG